MSNVLMSSNRQYATLTVILQFHYLYYQSIHVPLKPLVLHQILLQIWSLIYGLNFLHHFSRAVIRAVLLD
jgi:hypothetical protein